MTVLVRRVGPAIVAGFALVACATVSPASPAAAVTATKAEPTVLARIADGRSLVAAEEFDGAGLDLGRWSPYNARSSNGVSTWSAEQLEVAGGELRIVGEGRDPSGAGNASGAVCWCGAEGNHTYGRFAIKAKLDPGKGYGPAILLWPESDIWPKHGEIDVIESVQPNRVSDLASMHWGDPPRGERDSGKLWGDFTDWRIYWVDWQPNYVKIYVDDHLVFDSTKSQKKPEIPSNPMHVVLQQEPGPYAPESWLPAPDASTPEQVVMHVDWVRVYR